MLWDSIYEFFVTHVFGGYLGSGDNVVAYWVYYGHNPSTGQPIYTSKVPVEIFGETLSVGNYLSMVATFISISIIIILCCLFIWKIIKLIGGLIR